VTDVGVTDFLAGRIPIGNDGRLELPGGLVGPRGRGIASRENDASCCQKWVLGATRSCHPGLMAADRRQLRLFCHLP
jgi:hypothetical protein